MSSLVQDLRFAVRQLWKSPSFAVVAVLTLGLGIGASAAIFSVVDGVLLRPLPYAHADRLVVLWNRLERDGNRPAPIAAPDVAEYRSRAESFGSFAFVARAIDAGLTREGEPAEAVRLGRVTPNLFSLLGVRPALGRTFRPGEGIVPSDAEADSARALTPMALVLSHEVWRRAFGGDPDVVGRRVELDGLPAVVIGVMPPGFRLLLPPKSGIRGPIGVWTPLRSELAEMRRLDRLRDQDSDNTGAVLARLKPGASLTEARAEMDAIAARDRRESAYHRNAGVSIELADLRDAVVAPARPILLALAGAVVILLLIACMNVANLVLVRATGRSRELALRLALGAGRGRIVRQVLTENGLIAVVGGAAGLVASRWAVDLLLAARPAELVVGTAVRLDGRILLFALVLVIGVTLLFGLLPALEASSGGGINAFRSRTEARGSSTSRLRPGLVVLQVALSLVLLAGAGLLVRSLWRLRGVNPGFRPENVLTFDMTLRHAERYRGPAERARLVRQLEDRLGALPGVEAVGLTGSLPLSGRSWTQPYGRDGQPVEDWSANEADFRMVTSGYFRAMGTRLLAGRGFTRAEDLHEENRVVIIDRDLARRIAPEGSAVGRRIGFPLDGEPVRAEVVGVVEDVRQESLRAQEWGTIYVPYRQEASRDVSLVVRTAGPPLAWAGRVRGAVAAMAPEFPIRNLRTMEDYLAGATADVRYTLALMAAFAVAALALAGIGLWGVIAFAVSQRRREIGVRMALGAPPARVAREIALGGMRLVGPGLLAGLIGAALLTPVLRGLLFRVAPVDPTTYGGVLLLVLAVSAAACYGPARRASRIDPTATLRGE